MSRFAAFMRGLRPKFRLYEKRVGPTVVRISVAGDDRCLAFFDEPDSPDALRDEGWPDLDPGFRSAYSPPRDRLP